MMEKILTEQNDSVKTVITKVINNRMQFRCSKCRAKRNLPVQANIRRKRVPCQKCGAITICNLNRRLVTRRFQSGKVVMIASDGQRIDVQIFNISDYGIGVEIPANMIRSYVIKVGEKFRFECNWNPHLLRYRSFIIKNISGQRIGLEKIRRGGW
jgi:hypothetical protein